MKSQFGKFENEVIKCWSQTTYYEFFLAVQHDFGLLDIRKKISALNFSILTSKFHLAEKVPSLK
jgi:hypothetical protein